MGHLQIQVGEEHPPTVYVDHDQGTKLDQQLRSDCVVGGKRFLSSGKGDHPSPTATPIQNNCVLVSSVNQSLAKKQVVLVSGQLPPTTPYMQVLQCIFSAVNGNKD